MKRFLVVGLGHFGLWVASELDALGHEVIAVDRDAKVVDRHADVATRCVVGDATDRRLLEEIRADNVDAAIVSTGEDLAAGILVALALGDLGLREIYVKVTSPEAARAVESMKIREAIFPAREAATRLAHRLASRSVLNYMPLAEGYSIQEVAIPEPWLGRTLRQLALPQRHGIQVVAIYDVLTSTMQVVPDPDQPLKESDVLIVAGKDDGVAEILGEKRG